MNDDINKNIGGMTNDQNTPLDDFDGLSPNQMEQILYYPFEDNKIIKFAKKSVHGIFAESPLFLIAWDLLNAFSEKSGVKLDPKGYLPPKLVKSIYNKGYSPDELIENGEIELSSEPDWLLLFIVKHLLLITELAEIKDNVISLTQKGSELFTQKSDYTVYMELLKAYCLGFGWANTDFYGSEEIGQVGFMYLLYLLKKYGAAPRDPAFYETRYFRAFPNLYVEHDDDMDEDDDDEFQEENPEDLEPEKNTDDEYVPDPEEERMACLELRFFERFCHWFGLAEIEMDLGLPGNELSIEMSESMVKVKRSKLFERIII